MVGSRHQGTRGGGVTYHIGQIVPMRAARGIWRSERRPGWFIFTTPPQAEARAAAWLREVGADECWFPVEERWRTEARGKTRRVSYLAPVAPRYLFAVLSFDPHWDVLFDRAKGKISKVIARDGVPLEIPEQAMLEMRQVPRRIEAMREEIRRASEIRPGDRAEIVAGPLAGWTVDVTRIHAGIAHFIVPLLGRSEAKIAMGDMRKIQGLAG